MSIRERMTRRGAVPVASALGPTTPEAIYSAFSSAGDASRRRKDYADAIVQYQQGLQQARTRQDGAAEEVFLGLLGGTYVDMEDYDQALAVLTEALGKATVSGAIHRKARALLNLGAYHLRRAELEEAKQQLEQALSLARLAQDTTILAVTTYNLSDLYMRESNPGYAARLLKDAVAQTATNPTYAAGLYGRLGKANIVLGDTDKGRQQLLQAMALADQTKQLEQVASWGAALADQCFADGLIDEALQRYSEVDALIERGYGDLITPEYRIQSLLNRALGNQALNRFDQALIDAQQALKAARTAQDPQLHATALYAVGQSQLKLEQPVALETLEQAVTRFAALQPDPASPLALSYIKALIGLGTAKQGRNDIVGALSQFEQALALVTPTDRLTRAQILRSMGTAYQAQGNLTLALEKWAEALALYEQANATVPMARLLCDIGVTRRQLLGLNAAIQSFERATMLLSSVKDLNTRGFVLSNVANLYTELGDIDTARSFYQEAIYLARQAANRRLESLRLGNLGWFNIMVGQPEEALRLLQEALQISQTLNDALMVAVQTSNLGLAQHDLKRFSDAEESFREAIRAAETVTDAFTEKRWEALFRSNLGRTLNAQQRYDEALEQLTQALNLSRAIGDQEITARVLVRMAEAYLQQGQSDLAEPLLHESELIARKIGYRRAEAECYVAQAALASARQDLTARDVALRNAQKTYQILHDPLARDLERTLEQASATPI